MAFTSANTPPFVECMAISTTGDATGTYNRYAWTISNVKLQDYPKLAVWPDGYYMSSNQFDSSGNRAGAGAIAFERSQMLLGQPAQARYFDLVSVQPNLWGMLPADVDGAAPPAGASDPYVVLSDSANDANDHLEVWRFHVDWTLGGGSTFTRSVQLAPAVFNTNLCNGGPCVPQPNTTQKLDPVAGGQLMNRLQYRNFGGYETLVSNATVDAGSDVAGIRWFELRDSGAGWTIRQQSTYKPADGNHRFSGSAAMDRLGDIALGFSVSGSVSPAGSPSIAYVVRAAADTLGQLGTEVILQAGVNQLGSARWGDYSNMTVDPVDDCTFWFTHEFYGATGSWRTRIASFRLPGCNGSSTAPVNSATPAITGLPAETQTLTVSTGTWPAAPAFTYQWRRCRLSGLECVDIANATSSSYVLQAADANGSSVVRAAITATTGGGTTRVISPPTTLVQSLPPVNQVLPAASGTPQVGLAVSTSTGTWTSSSPISYTYQWQRCTSGICSIIPGATTSSYTVAFSDLGTKVQAVVSATNTGGGTSATSAQTATVVAAASGGSSPPSPSPGPSPTPSPPTGGAPAAGGGGGGGGGGGVPPEVALSMSYGPQPQNVGDQFVYAVALYNNSIQGSDKTVLTVNLPAGVEYLGAHVNRGPGCSAAGQVLTCNLDWFPGKFGDTVTISVKVTQKADLTATASVWSTPADSNPANDTASATVKVGASTSTGASSTGASTPLGPDTIVPKAGALPSSAQSGTTAKLHFTIYDDRGIADARVTVKQGTKTIASLRSGFGPVAYGLSYYMPWRVPKSVHGVVTFCVTAVDKSSNSSKPSCSKLNVK
jgi:hypothetical protein